MADLSKWIASLHCPTRAEMVDVAIAMLPRGRAWQTDEGGPDRGAIGGFQRGAFQSDAFAVERREPSILFQYWSAVGEFFLFAAQRICALRLEFWCATKSETTDLWMEEYGLPDNCDPFPDLCAKVAAIGGTRCEYYAAVAARAGWSITCDEDLSCGFYTGCAQLGFSQVGGARLRSKLIIVINLGESPAFHSSGFSRYQPMAGCFFTGRPLSCEARPVLHETQALECIMSRVVHAEIEIQYEVNYG